MGKGPISIALCVGLALAGSAMVAARAQQAPCANLDAIGTARTIILPAGQHVGASTGYPSLRLAPGEVVLTFDDGPSPQNTPSILETLARNCVLATFFPIGANAEAEPDLLKRVIAGGHSLGGHTWSHEGLPGMPVQRAISEIEKGLAPLRRTGAKIGFFRFPMLVDSPALLSWLDRAGLATIGVDIDPEDWSNAAPERSLARIRAQLAERGERGIILMHDSQPNTARLLPDLLSFLKQRGYRVVHIAPPTRD